MKDFGGKGISGWGLRWFPFKGEEPIGGADSRLGMTSSSKLDTGDIKVSIV